MYPFFVCNGTVHVYFLYILTIESRRAILSIVIVPPAAIVGIYEGLLVPSTLHVLLI